MTLDLSPLARAIEQLDQSLQYAESDLAATDPQLARLLRSAAIQAFEFTYELAWKMLKRHLSATEPNPAEIDELSFPDLIRLGSRRGLLLSDWERWKEYRADRGATSHTYDEDKAGVIFQSLPGFLAEARHLYDRLSERQARA